MKYLFSAVLTVASCTATVTAVAAPADTAKNNSVMLANSTTDNTAIIKQKFLDNLGLNAAKVAPSPMPGVFEVITDQGLFYTNADGSFLLHGKMYAVGDTVTNLTEDSLAQVRVDGMAKFANDVIEFKAKDEKHVVTVFTDITCGYCRKMHDQMEDYNDRGITVRYLAYPRAGVKDRTGQFSQGFKDLRSIWCHEDPQSALTKAKAGSNVAARICDKPIEDEFLFGRQVGVTGTPAIMLSNGMMIPGYQDPAKLETILSSVQQGS